MVVVRVATTLVCGVLLLGACSGAEEQDVLGPSSSSGAGSGSGGSDGGAGSSPGQAPTSGPGDSTPPARACDDEEESNDSHATANELEHAVCGEVSNGDPIDVLTFTLAEGTRSMAIDFTGSVRLTVSAFASDTVELTPTSSPSVPFVVGKPYFVEVRALEKAPRTAWRVDLVTK